MKKIKGLLPTTMLLAVMAFGTTFAHAGLLISDLSGNGDTVDVNGPCVNQKDGIIINSKDGIIINSIKGIIINSLTGIIINSTDSASSCGSTNQKDGIIINS